MKKGFIDKLILYFIGNFASKILVTLLIPIYAAYVSATELGIFDYIQALMNIIVVIFFFAIWEAVLRFILCEKRTVIQKYISNILFFSGISSIIVFIATVGIFKIWGYRTSLVIITAIMYMLYGLGMVWQYIARGLSENTIYVKSGIIGTITNFICVVLFVCIKHYGAIGLLVSYTLGRLFIILYIEIKLELFHLFKVKDIELKIIKQMLNFSFPLAINSLAAWLLTGIGSILIVHYLGVLYNGLYAFASKFSALIISVGSIFVMALMEEAIWEFKKIRNVEKLCKIISRLFKLFETGIIFLLPIIVMYYILFVKNEYFDSEKYIPLVLLYALFSVFSSIVGTLFQILDKTKYQFITTLAGACGMIIISIVFIGQIGVYAILIGQSVGALIMFLSRLFLVSQDIRLEIPYKDILLDIGVYWGVIALLFMKKSVIMCLIILLTTICMECFRYKSTLKVVVSNFKRKIIKVVRRYH